MIDSTLAAPSINASLDEVRLVDLLSLLSGRTDDAVIDFKGSQGACEMHVSGGYVEWVWSSFHDHLFTGEVLCQMGVINPAALERAFLEQQSDDPLAGGTKPIGSYLLQSKLVTEADIAAALTIQVAESALRLLAQTSGSVSVMLGETGRVPFRAHIPLTDIIAESTRRGPSFTAFDPTNKPEVSEQRLPPNLRSVFRVVASIREMANTLGKPEWALANALEARLGKLVWVSGSLNRPRTLTVEGLRTLLKNIQTELSQDRSREALLRKARRFATAITRLESYYLSNGLTQAAQANLIESAVAKLVAEQRTRTRYPVEGLIRVLPNDGGIDLGLANGLINAMTEGNRRSEVESRLTDALSEVLRYVFLACTRQIPSALDRRQSEEALENFRVWLLDN